MRIRSVLANKVKLGFTLVFLFVIGVLSGDAVREQDILYRHQHREKEKVPDAILSSTCGTL